MLKENPAKRPNIYQVVSEVCSMRNKPVPIKDVSIMPLLRVVSPNSPRSIPIERHQRLAATKSFRHPQTIQSPVLGQLSHLQRRKQQRYLMSPRCAEAVQHNLYHNTLLRDQAHLLSETYPIQIHSLRLMVTNLEEVMSYRLDSQN